MGTHMLLWVPSQDLVVRPWGYSLHGRESESHGGTNHVAPEAASRFKAQAEAKFIIYCVVLH
jgi:hypothetical protein